MLKLLILSALIALTLAHGGGPGYNSDSSSSSEEHDGAHCPGHASHFSTLGTIPTCVNGTNGTTPFCTQDANCSSPQKCCTTSCGKQCVNAILEVKCTTASQCSGETPICCAGICATVCSTPPPPPNKKPFKGKGKH